MNPVGAHCWWVCLFCAVLDAVYWTGTSLAIYCTILVPTDPLLLQILHCLTVSVSQERWFQPELERFQIDSLNGVPVITALEQVDSPVKIEFPTIRILHIEPPRSGPRPRTD